MILGRSIGNFEQGVSKTGQTVEYGSGTGADDGFYEAGIAHRYEVLTTGQYSGTVAITLNGKTNNRPNSVAIDHLRKLMWSNVLSASVGTGSDGKLPWTTNGSGEGIFPYCAAANVASLAGYTNWRIPNVKEFWDLIEFAAPAAAFNATAFAAFTTTFTIWTGTTHPTSTTAAYTAGAGSPAKTATNYCVLVRPL